VQVSFIDAQFVQSEADLLFSVTVAGQPGYVYFLFEHQSTPDTFMMLRLLGYMVRVWKSFHRKSPERDRLPVIIPMVLFHGPKGWQAPLSFRSLVDLPAESFAPYTPAFECELYDLSPWGKDQLAGGAVIRILGDLLGACGRPDAEDRVRRAFDTLNELLNAPGFARYLEIFFRYVLHVFDIPKERLRELVAETLQRDVTEWIMTTYEQLKQEGASRVLSRQLSRRFPGDAAHLLPLLSRLSPEQQEELAEKILEVRTLEEIREWLDQAGKNREER
jgi:hypothetical protein